MSGKSETLISGIVIATAIACLLPEKTEVPRNAHSAALEMCQPNGGIKRMWVRERYLHSGSSLSVRLYADCMNGAEMSRVLNEKRS